VETLALGGSFDRVICRTFNKALKIGEGEKFLGWLEQSASKKSSNIFSHLKLNITRVFLF